MFEVPKPVKLSQLRLGVEKPDVRFWQKPLLKWSTEFSLRDFDFSDPFIAKSSTPGYFGSALADKPMRPGGRYYLEFRVYIKDSSKQVKVGVSKGRNMNGT